jgi:hypothetical protein
MGNIRRDMGKNDTKRKFDVINSIPHFGLKGIAKNEYS